jgi:hypothetical protein
MAAKNALSAFHQRQGVLEIREPPCPVIRLGDRAPYLGLHKGGIQTQNDKLVGETW